MTTFLNAEASMKTLKILKRAEPEFKNTFVCQVETMFGDADDDATITFAITADVVDDLEKLFTKLRQTDDADYHEVKDFARFFILPYRYEDSHAYKGEAPALETGIDWPYHSDCDYYYGYVSHQYFWYDENGLKHETKVVTKK